MCNIPWNKVLVIIPFIFIVAHCVVMPTCPPNFYSHFDSGAFKCCKYCLPGTYLKEHCFRSNTSECAPCPENHYTDNANKYEQCIRCTKCPSRTYLKTPCSKTADSICNCITGFFFKSISNTCEKCKTCPVGEGVVDECSHSSRRTCRSCLEGVTFSNRVNGKCLPCRHCGVNEIKTANCTVLEDTQCRKVPTKAPEQPLEGDTKNIIVISVTLTALAITLIILCIFLVRRKVTINCCYREGDQPTTVSSIERRAPAERPSTSADMQEGQVQLRVHCATSTDDIRDCGLTINEVPYPQWEELAKKLDPDAFRHKNWRSLAGLLSYNQIDIENFGRDESPTLRVLMEYGTQKNCSVHRLYQALVKIKREDCVRILKDAVSGKASNV